MAETSFSCRCGQLTGRLTGIDPREGTHVVCHCKSCRKAEEKAGFTVTEADGVDLFQTTPDRIVIETGLDQLVPKEFGAKGILRWHAACCNTPMFNTMKRPGLSFVGVITRNLSDPAPVGPVIAHGFVTKDNGKQTHQNGTAVIGRLLKRAIFARLSGRARQNPFFDDRGKPVAPVQPLH